MGLNEAIFEVLHGTGPHATYMRAAIECADFAREALEKRNQPSIAEVLDEIINIIETEQDCSCPQRWFRADDVKTQINKLRAKYCPPQPEKEKRFPINGS